MVLGISVLTKENCGFEEELRGFGFMEGVLLAENLPLAALMLFLTYISKVA
jgi:hypothetical protein